MSRAWINDLWVKNKSVVPAGQLKNIRNLDPQYRSAKYGRGRRWLVQWRDPDKKLKSKSFDTKPEAEAYKAELEDDHRSGRYIDPTLASTLFQDVAEHWLANKRSVKEATRNYYRRILDDRILPTFGQLEISRIQETSVNDWVNTLEAEGLKATYITSLLKTLRSILKSAVQRRLIASNPAGQVEAPRAEPKDPVYLTVGEVDALAEGARHVGGDQAHTMILTLAYTGLRIGEAVTLRVGDVHLPTRRLHVQRTLTDETREGVPKSGKDRRVPLPSLLMGPLGHLLMGRGDDDYLFTDSQGGRINVHNWRARIFTKAVSAAGLEAPGLTPHGLRHTYASLSIKAGVDVITLQAAMGHSTATETLNTYAHLWPEKLDSLADALDKMRG